LCEISWRVELLLELAALVQEQQGVKKQLVLRSAAARASSSGAGTAGCGKAGSVEVCLCEISYRVEILLEIAALVQGTAGCGKAASAEGGLCEITNR
jgi:hypothetical protein